jgi:hypothetical protein
MKKGGKYMEKAFKKITFALLISLVLTFNGLALPNDQGRPKDKPREQPKETPKRDKEDRGGRDRGEKRDRKSEGAFFN